MSAQQKVIRDRIGRLIRLSALLRQASRLNREEKATKYEPKDWQGNSLFPEFAEHVKFICNQHFKGNKREGEVDNMLEGRIEAAIIRRWRRICYWNHHGLGLATSKSQPVPAPKEKLVPAASAKPQRSQPPKTHPSQPTSANYKGSSSGKTKESSATTAPEGLKLGTKEPSKAMSVGTSATKMRGGRLSFPHSPHLPKDADEFECPYCRLYRPARDLESDRWKYVEPFNERYRNLTHLAGHT